MSNINRKKLLDERDSQPTEPLTEEDLAAVSAQIAIDAKREAAIKTLKKQVDPDQSNPSSASFTNALAVLMLG